MAVANQSALIRFALAVVAIFVGLTMATSILGIVIKTWPPGFDLATMQAVASHRSSSLTSLARIVSTAGSFVLLGPLAIAFVLLRRWKRPADDLALIVIAGGSALLSILAKAIVDRPRPTVEHLSHLSSTSFPSEHSTQAAAIYLIIAVLLSQGLRRGWRELVIVLAVAIAVAVAWSRVYQGVHYPTDVAAGLVLGWSWALLVFQWARPTLLQTP